MFGDNKALLYQQHKDALDQVYRLLSTHCVPGTRDLRVAANVPLEFRAFLHDCLETLQWHFENTMVPAQLGDAAMVRELIPVLTQAQMFSTGQCSYETRQNFRVLTYNRLFEGLRQGLAQARSSPLRSLWAGGFKDSIPHAEEAFGWFANEPAPGLTVPLQEAWQLIQTAKAAP